MNLLLIRHGESEADLLDVHEGRADFALTQRGHRQARRTAEYLSEHYQIEKIYASTLKRARQTAEHLAEAAGCEIFPDENLMEFNNGQLAGLPRAVAAKKYPPVKDLPADQAVYGMETAADFRKRAERALARVLKECESDRWIAIVSHGGMIDQLYKAMLRLPVGCDVFFSTGDAGVHVWQVRGGSLRVLRANLTEHIGNL